MLKSYLTSSERQSQNTVLQGCWRDFISRKAWVGTGFGDSRLMGWENGERPGAEAVAATKLRPFRKHFSSTPQPSTLHSQQLCYERGGQEEHAFIYLFLLKYG